MIIAKGENHTHNNQQATE